MDQHPNTHYDAPHDVGNQYLQWRLHEEKMEKTQSHWDVSMMPNCLHCSGSAPCTAKVCINCARPYNKNVQ